MDVTIALEVTGTVDENGQLHLDEPLSALDPGRVRVIVLSEGMARARVNTLEDLIAKRAELTEICRRNDISYLGVFGSFAHNEVTFTSDVDLLVHFSKDKSLLDLVGIENEFTEVLRRKVDLLTEDAISPYLKDRVLAEVKVIYEKAG